MEITNSISAEAAKIIDTVIDKINIISSSIDNTINAIDVYAASVIDDAANNTMNKTECKYLKLVEACMKGELRITRNGRTLGTFGKTLRFYTRSSLGYHMPLLTTKKMSIAPIHWELLWFLRGDTNVKYLNDHGVKFWNENANSKFLAARGLNYPSGELGPIYGAQWRGKCSHGIDQIEAVIKSLREDPMGRRHIVCSWNVLEIDKVALPPCHWAYQFYIDSHGLSIMVHMRSGDICLGVPYNLVSYTMLLYIIAAILRIDAHCVVITFGDLHIYEEHVANAIEQCSRTPAEFPIANVDPASGQIGDISLEKSTSLTNDSKLHSSVDADAIASRECTTSERCSYATSERCSYATLEKCNFIKKINTIEDALALEPSDWGIADYSPAAQIKYVMKV